jgi:hypothetical protein
MYGKINLTPSEWKAIVVNKLDGATSEGRMMRCLARIPDFIERGKKVRRGDYYDPDLLEEARSNYATFKAASEELHNRLDAAEKSNETLNSAFSLHAYYERIYGFGLAVGIILNCVLSAIDVDDFEITLESERFSREIITLSEPAKRFRPLWSSYMILCLMAAWIGTTNPSVTLLAEREIEDYQRDYFRGRITSLSAATSTITYLEQISQQLHLLEMDSEASNPGFHCF